jgi:NDP-sugar pyrophosphorylase family protein
MKAMVLAAGVGSRLDPLTSQIPKPLVPVANRPVIEHILHLLIKHGITDVAANLHHLPDKLIEYCGDGTKFGINLRLLVEEKLSGDAGGVRACRDFLADGTFIVLMGDLLTDANLSEIVAAHKAKRALATIALKHVDDVSQFGVAITNKEGFIVGFQEKPKQEEALSDLASTGIYIFEPEIFHHIPEQGEYGFGRQLFPKLVSQSLPVLGYTIGSYWSDVGTIKQYRQSNFDALDGKIKVDLPGTKRDTNGGTLWLGEGSQIADNCQIDGLLMLGKGSRILPGVRIKGKVIIGDNCLVSEGAVIENSVIWSDSKIEGKANLKDCVIGSNCHISNGTQHQEVATVA